MLLTHSTSALQAGGHWFESSIAHRANKKELGQKDLAPFFIGLNWG